MYNKSVLYHAKSEYVAMRISGAGCLRLYEEVAINR